MLCRDPPAYGTSGLDQGPFSGSRPSWDAGVKRDTPPLFLLCTTILELQSNILEVNTVKSNFLKPVTILMKSDDSLKQSLCF